ncbi:MAG: alternative ribosome rescue aminoacyl-tRNA hydrolase ArfB [Myxococcota bacterium]
MKNTQDSDDLVINDALTVPASDLSWTASRSSGPGGQNVNKVATKVTLRFDLRGTRVLNRFEKARLRKIAGRRLDANGALLIMAQAERTQRRNLSRARHTLRRLILAALPPPKRRVATKPSAGVKRRRVDNKRRQGEKKRSRRRVTGDPDA